MIASYLPLLLSVLAFIISVFSFFYFRSYLRARTSQARILAEMREEVNSILKSINETTDRDISLIEEREKNLKALLDDIEKRLKVYIREVELRRAAEDAYRELGKNRYRLRQASRSEADSRSESVSRESDSRESDSGGESEARRETVQQNPDTQEAAPHGKPSFPTLEFEVKSGSTPSPSQENHASVGEQIRSLVRAGFSVPVIASRLGISISEVELAAALMERRDAE